MNSDLGHSQRVLLLASDDLVSAWDQGLRDAGLSTRVCKDSQDLCLEMASGVGAVLTDAGSLTSSVFDILEQQPSWSEIPVIALGEVFTAQLNIISLPTNIPLPALVSLLKWSLRCRQRQYEGRLLQNSLQRMKEAGNKARHAKSQFLANMSHELRTPIGAIMGFADLAAEPAATPEERRDFITIVQRNSRQLLDMIDDVLDYSRLESGKLDIERTRFRPVDFVTDFANSARPKVSEKGLEFALEYRTDLPEWVLSDPARLRQILWNLIGNSIKFTPRGRITLAVSYVRNHLVFSITDTGIGIVPNQRPRLFEAFAQADASSSRRYGGTGIGLALSRHLAQALGGDVDLVCSEPGVGSEFRITIDATPTEGARLLPATMNEAGDLQGMQVLLVEDSVDNQVLLSTLLRRHGAEIEIADNGAEGSDAALSGNYDVVLMDVHMPVMDGHMATRKLRRMNYEKPIIALTAHALNEERLRCLASGFSEYLTKPVQLPVLLSVLNRYKTNSNHSKIPG